MALEPDAHRLAPRDPPQPTPGPGQVLLRVRACAVCRTDLHILDGELPPRRRPLVPGHQIVGIVEAVGERGVGAEPPGGAACGLAIGARVGVPWLAWTCGVCDFCRGGRENLCDRARFTGYDVDGGYAEWAVADARFCFPIPDGYPDLQAAPLLCAGLIGYRSLRLAGDAETLGIYGFGAAAHLVTQVARFEGRRVIAFTRAGDAEAQRFALELGAEQALASDRTPDFPLDAAILFAPAGELVPAALRAVRKGGTVVCGGIHMSDIPRFPYELLWGERVVRSVANLTRRDGVEFLALAPTIPVRTEVVRFDLAAANDALDALRRGAVRGAAVLDLG
jgi:propanol-preferring alcohol dehydrogenase